MLAVILIVAFTIFTFFFWVTNISDNKKFFQYLSTLSTFSTIIIIISFIYSIKQGEKEDIRRQADRDEKKSADFINETEKNWIDIEKFFNINYPYLSQLYKEIYQNNILIPSVTLTPEQQTESKIKEQHATQILFQTIENIISTTPVIKNAKWGWIKIFQSWSKSQIFQSNWSYSKNFYNPKTQEFIDGLINNKFSSSKDIQTFLSIKHESTSEHWKK